MSKYESSKVEFTEYDDEAVGILEWLITIPILLIPVIGMFGSIIVMKMEQPTGNMTKNNFAIGCLFYQLFFIFIFL